MKIIEDKVNHDLYFSIAKNELNKAIKINEEINQITTQSSVFGQVIGGNFNDVTHDQFFDLRSQVDQATIISVVFSALTAEAFINYYALFCGYSEDEKIETKEKNILKKKFNLESISGTTIKWINIPYKKTGKYLRKDLIKRLQNLFTIRNKLVHYKSYIPQAQEQEENFKNLVKEMRGLSSEKTKWDLHFIQVSLEDAIKSKDTIINLLNELKSIDPSINHDWIK